MFCEKCGAQLRDDARFCEKCGARIETGDPQPPQGFVQQPQQEFWQNQQAAQFQQPQQTGAFSGSTGNAGPAMGSPAGSGKKLPKGFPAVIGVAAAAVILVLVLIFTGKTRVNLNKYVTISCSGYDTVGRASFEFDYDSFIRDYQGKIKYKNRNSLEDFDLSSQDAFVSPAEVLIETCVEGELDETAGLSNGDTVIFTWECKDELAEEMFGCRLKYKDIEYTVEDLEEVETFNPFENIKLVYSGVAPMGSVRVENQSDDEMIRNLDLSVTPCENLSNGDTITISIDADNTDYLAETYGRVPSVTEQEYVVDGLGSYVTSLAELPAETLDQMKSQSEDVIRAEAARSWDEHVSIDDMAYLGSYLLTAKSQEVSGAHNKIYMVYKIRAAEDYPEQEIYQGMRYYYYVSFHELVLFPDNTCSVDLGNYDTCGKSFDHRTEYGDGWFDYINVRYRGYENLDTLFNDCVTSEIDSYTYEDSVADIEM